MAAAHRRRRKIRYVEHGLLDTVARLIRRQGATKPVQLAAQKLLLVIALDVDSELKRAVADACMGARRAAAPATGPERRPPSPGAR